MSPRSPRPAAIALVGIALALVAALGGCGKKRERPSGPPPEVTGLAAVPESADVIVGVEVARLVESPLIVKMAEMVLAREPTLAARWQSLRTSCKLDEKQVHHLMVALGPPKPGGRFGTGPMILIATGKISEPDLVACVRDIVGKGGGSLVVKNQGGRSLYQVKDGARTMFIAFGRPDTVILGNSDAYVLEAVGTGKKALDNPELAAWLKEANQRAPLWVVGRVAESLKAGLIRASGNALEAGAKAFLGSVDLTSGVQGELTALMESPKDAKELQTLVNSNLGALTWAAQRKQLARVVNKLSVSAQGASVRFSVALSMDDVNRVLSVLDGDQSPAQDSPPASGSASTPPAP